MRILRSIPLFLLLSAVAVSCLQPIEHKPAPPAEAVEPGEFRLTSASADPIDDSQIIDGYTDRIAYSPGDTIRLYINAKSTISKASIGLYDIRQNRIGLVTGQIAPRTITAEVPYQEGFGYTRPLKFVLPPALRSGMYRWGSSIPFLIRGNVRTTTNKAVVVYPSNTEAAYNSAGGKSLYTKPERARTVSFHRPRTIGFNQLAFLEWAWDTNLPVDYISDADMDEYSRLQPYKVVMTIGHSEYWSLKARQNFDRFIDAGGHGLVLSGNTMWWRISYAADGKQMLCSRDWSIDNWDNPALSYPIGKSLGASFTLGGYGFSREGYTNSKGGQGFLITAPDSPLLTGTGLKSGDLLAVPTDEYDGVPLTYPTDSALPQWVENPHGFVQQRLIGYDHALDVNDNKGKPVYGTFVVFRKSAASGYIINTASTDWCSGRGIGGRDGEKIKRITLNALTLLLTNQSPL